MAEKISRESSQAIYNWLKQDWQDGDWMEDGITREIERVRKTVNPIVIVKVFIELAFDYPSFVEIVRKALKISKTDRFKLLGVSTYYARQFDT